MHIIAIENAFSNGYHEDKIAPPPPAANLVPRAFPLKNGWGGKSPGDEVVLLRYYFRSRKSTETGVSLTHVWFGYQKWSKSPPFMEPCYR